jgi:hypothetical protein
VGGGAGAFLTDKEGVRIVTYGIAIPELPVNPVVAGGDDQEKKTSSSTAAMTNHFSKRSRPWMSFFTPVSSYWLILNIKPTVNKV